MDATVTLKVTPREFDLIREAVTDSQDDAREAQRDGSPKERTAARQREAEYALLTEKLH